MRFLIAILLLLFCSALAAQHKGERQAIEDALVQYEGLENDPQLFLLERSLQKCEADFPPNDTTTAKVNYALATWHADNRDFDKALSFSNKNLEIQKRLDSLSLRTAQAYTQVAEQYVALYKFPKAEKHFQYSINLDAGTKVNFQNYLGLAKVLHAQGNYSLLKEYAKHAYDLATTPSDKCEALHLQLTGSARMSEIEKSNEIVEEILTLSKKYGLTYHRGRAYAHLGWINNIIARAHRKRKNHTAAEEAFHTAIQYYNKGISFLEKSDSKEKHKPIMWAYTNISNQYKYLNKKELAIQYAKLAVNENQDHHGGVYQPSSAFFYYNLAAKYASFKDFEASIRQQQNAIKCLLGDENFSDSRKTIPKEDLYKVSIKWRLLESLKEKALCYAHLYLEHKNREDLESSERHLSNAVELIDIMRAELSTDETKVYWRKRTKTIYDTAIEMSDWLEDHERILKYMEKSRSLLLLDELNHKEAMSMIPARLAEKEKQLRDAFTDATDNTILKFKEYNDFLTSLKENYSSYYKYKFDVQTPTIKEVQDEILDDSTQVLNYYITYDSIYLLNITKTSSELVTKKNDRQLDHKVNNFLGYLDNKDSLEFQVNFEAFTKVSHELHELLFSGITQKRHKSIIIGDGAIDYIPFDVLVSSINQGKPKYLIEDHIFCNAPSLSILRKYSRQSNFNNLLLVSPGKFSELEMSPLVESKDELSALEKFSDTEVLRGENATFSAFSEISSNYDVIHFSTHSGIHEDTEQPWIAFNDSLISLNEVYKLKLNASLVTLSSCKSLDGKDRSGEGINSLARAFLFADSEAVIGSIWNLNESSGREVIRDFYKSLKNDELKPTALRKAKMKYIKNNPYKSPFYWAPLVLIGDPGSLDSAPKESGFKFLYLLGIIMLCYLLWSKVSKRDKAQLS